MPGSNLQRHEIDGERDQDRAEHDDRERRVHHRAAPDTGRNVLMMPMRALSAP